MYGIIEYNQDGLPKCEICGKYFHRVLSHVRQKHNLNEREYKKSFGFDVSKGICSQESRSKSSIMTLLNYDKCVNKNLLAGGLSTRFKKGDNGRTKDMVSEQTRIMLTKQIKESVSHETRVLTGRKVGSSGLGNLKRWGNGK